MAKKLCHDLLRIKLPSLILTLKNLIIRFMVDLVNNVREILVLTVTYSLPVNVQANVTKNKCLQ